MIVARGGGGGGGLGREGEDDIIEGQRGREIELCFFTEVRTEVRMRRGKERKRKRGREIIYLKRDRKGERGR